MTQSPYSQNNCYQNCDFRLTFGLPLEDVFPNGEIHPSLKRLFSVTYRYFTKTNTKHALQCLIVNDTLTCCMPKLLDLIDALTFGRAFPAMLSFELLIRTLRHYLAALPVPLMPKYTNKQHFNWKKLSLECRRVIQLQFQNNRRNDVVLDKLARELLRLPKVNLLLIGYFVNFLRSLVQYGKFGQHFNKRSACILINYFSGSIFTNKYENVTQKLSENPYHPLMLLLIVKWPEIQQKCIEKQPKCFSSPAPAHRNSHYIPYFPNEFDAITNSSFDDDGNYIQLPRLPSPLSTIEEGKEVNCACRQRNVIRTSRSTATSFQQSVETQIGTAKPEVNKDSQTPGSAWTKSKKTSTVSLLQHIRNGGQSSYIDLSSRKSMELGNILKDFTYVSFDELKMHNPRVCKDSSKSSRMSMGSTIELDELDGIEFGDGDLTKQKMKLLEELNEIDFDPKPVVRMPLPSNNDKDKDEDESCKKSDELNLGDFADVAKISDKNYNRYIQLQQNNVVSDDQSNMNNVIADTDECLETLMIPNCGGDVENRSDSKEGDKEEVEEDDEGKEPFLLDENQRCKPRKSLMKIAKQLSGLRLMKQVKNLVNINRARSDDEFLQRHVKYRKLPDKNSSTF